MGTDLQKHTVRIGVVISALAATAVFTWQVAQFANSIDRRLTNIEMKLGIVDTFAKAGK